ncbi:MAG: DUF6596 domain-containing protein [Arachnia sp.]
MKARFEDVVARDAPRVLGALVRRYGSVADCEDAVQLALMAALQQWPLEGTPTDPRAWLMTVARRRLVDDVRSSTARKDRESLHLAGVSWTTDPFDGASPAGDDTLSCLLLCSNPALSRASQVALTLRVVSGLTTAQIASAFFVPESTMGQRISRAKNTLRKAGVDFRDDNRATDERLSAVRHILYLVFNEGYTSSGGQALLDVGLASEAIRLTRQLLRTAPGDSETMGLLGLMLLTHSRAATRTDERGDLVVLAEQDRSRWDHDAIAEGVRLVERALVSGPVGPFQIQAAIAAIHAEARTWAETDWPQILLLYEMLEKMNPGPAVSVNLAVATAMADTPEAGLAITRSLLDDPALSRNHRVHGVHAHLLSMAGDLDGAAACFSRAATLATSAPEQRYLLKMAAQRP